MFLGHVILLNFDQRDITEKCEVAKFKNYHKYNGKENAGPVKVVCLRLKWLELSSNIFINLTATLYYLGIERISFLSKLIITNTLL